MSDKIMYHLSSRMAKPNKIMSKEIAPFFKEQGLQTIFDYGCGKFLRDSKLLARRGFMVHAVDLPEQIERIKLSDIISGITLSESIPSSEYDAALLNFVLQSIENQEKRNEVLNKVYNALKQGGYLVLSALDNSKVKSTYERNKNWKKYNDGYITTMGTFVRGCEEEELMEIAHSLNLEVIKCYEYTAHVILLKKEP